MAPNKSKGRFSGRMAELLGAWSGGRPSVNVEREVGAASWLVLANCSLPLGGSGRGAGRGETVVCSLFPEECPAT